MVGYGMRWNGMVWYGKYYNAKLCSVLFYKQLILTFDWLILYTHTSPCSWPLLGSDFLRVPQLWNSWTHSYSPPRTSGCAFHGKPPAHEANINDISRSHSVKRCWSKLKSSCMHSRYYEQKVSVYLLDSPESAAAGRIQAETELAAQWTLPLTSLGTPV